MPEINTQVKSGRPEPQVMQAKIELEPQVMQEVTESEPQGVQAKPEMESGMPGDEGGQLVIRQMTREDCEAVAELFALCFSAPWSLNSVEDMFRFQGYMNLVAEQDGKVIAYIGCLRVMDEADITNVAVHPDYRGKKISTKLLKHFLGWMREEGVAFLYLEVRASNVPAIALYSHAGFIQNGLRKKYYSQPTEDALLMMWEDK